MDAMQIEIIYKIVMNTLLISIPEELYFVLFTYILMGEFDQWVDEDCERLFQPWDYPRVFIPTVAAALISNTLRYTGASSGIISFSTLLALFVGIVAMGDVFNNARALRWICSAFVFLLLAALYLALSELLYLPFLLYGTGKSLLEINNDISLNFFVFLPSRLLQYFLLAFLIVHKRSLLKARIFKMIFESRFLTVFTLVTLFSDFCFMVFIFKFVCYEKALAVLSANLRLATILGICLFPIINLSALFSCTYYVNNREAMSKKIASNTIKKIIEDIKTYSENGNYDNVVWRLNGLTTDLERVADNIYKEK